MFNFFRSDPFDDPDLGELRRRRGRWRGTLLLGDERVPLALSGPRAAPDPGAIAVARALRADFAAARPALERALFEHYAPYAEAAAEGGPADVPRIEGPPGVWPHAVAEFVHVAPIDGTLTAEVGYRVAWDEEHTLGARFREGRFVELSGSVLAP